MHKFSKPFTVYVLNIFRGIRKRISACSILILRQIKYRCTFRVLFLWYFREKPWYFSTNLVGSLPHCPERLYVGLQKGVAVVHDPVLLRESSYSRLHGPQVVPRKLGKQMVQRLGSIRTKMGGKRRKKKGIRVSSYSIPVKITQYW